MDQSSRRFFRLQRRIALFFVVVFVASLSAQAVHAAKKRRPSRSYPTVRYILIDRKNVFDPSRPGEGKWPFTWANAIHVTTREHVVRRELLVKPGDPADQNLLEESERNLRALTFIKDARIKTVPVGDGRVDLLVETHDSWTLQPQVNFGSEGEEDHFAMGILEENFFGFGKNLSYFYSDDPEGVSYQYGFIDPQLFGTRARLSTHYDDTPTGQKANVDLQRPFFSLKTRWAAGAGWNHSDEQQAVIENGVETDRYIQDHHDADAFIGLRVNRDPLSVHRLSLHYLHRSDTFRSVPQTIELPENKIVSGPALRWDWIESNFIKETFIDKAERVEDINLGHQVQITGGYASPFFGSSDHTLPFAASDSFGIRHKRNAFTLTSFGMTGRYNTYESGQQGGRLENTLYFFNANYYKHIPTEFPFTGVVHVESAYAQEADDEHQLVLGGDTGLRGFKVNSFTGNKSFLMNIEGRAYYPHEIFHLAYLGGAAFIDAGQVQPSGRPYNNKDFHASVGLGLRIGLTRSSEGSVYRFDVAYAIGKLSPAQDNRIVFSVTAGQGFKRQANTYSNFPGLPPATE